MIIALTWISILILFIIFYWYLKGTLKENAINALLIGFIALFFFLIDYQISESSNKILELNTIEKRYEYCDISLIWSKCWENKTLEFNKNNTQVQEYLAFIEAQRNITVVITQVVEGVFLFMLGYLGLQALYRKGVIK